MRAGLAFLAGAVGGLVMIILLWLARLAGIAQLNLVMILGAMITQEPSAGTWVLGFIMHLVISGLIALIYAVFFELFHRASWWLGLAFAVVHTIIGGFFMLILPVLHPAIPGEFPEPGYLAINLGVSTSITVILLHLVYGMIVGAIYESRRAVETPLTRTPELKDER